MLFISRLQTNIQVLLQTEQTPCPLKLQSWRMLCRKIISRYCYIYMYKQDQQCTYNVTLRRFPTTTTLQTSNGYYIFWMCVFRL